MSKLSTAALKSLDEELFEYNSIAREIAVRKVELDTQKEYDDNIGGGKANRISKVAEEAVIRYCDDARIQYLEKLRSDIENCYHQLDQELKDIFEMRWLLNESHSWIYIADKFNYSERAIYNKREKILELFAKIKGKL